MMFTGRSKKCRKNFEDFNRVDRLRRIEAHENSRFPLAEPSPPVWPLNPGGNKLKFPKMDHRYALISLITH